MKHKNTSLSNSDICKAFKSNNSEVLQSLYTQNFRNVELYILKNNGSQEIAKDIYQEAFLAVWKNIKNDKFTPHQENSVGAYLYTIAKNKWLDYLRSSQYKKTVLASQITHFEVNTKNDGSENDDLLKNKRLQVVMHAFSAMGSPCKDLLKQFYFDKVGLTEIAETQNISVASAKNKKYRCMQKLRELVTKK